MTAQLQLKPAHLIRGRPQRRGSLLLEASVALGMLVIVALMILKASMLALAGSQWTSMQTLTDAYLTMETALANRTPLADITSSNSLWPDAGNGYPQTYTVVTLGYEAGAKPVTGKLIRFRINATTGSDPVASLTVWRLHSLLRYQIGLNEYVKSVSTLRVQ